MFGDLMNYISEDLFTDIYENVIFNKVVVGAACWSFMYIVLRKILFRRKEPEFSSRIVAAVHAMIVTPLAFLCYYEGPNPFHESGTGDTNSELHILTLRLSLSYFIYDFCWCLYFQTEPVIMLIHHVGSIISISVILLHGQCGAEAVMGLGTMEASNPYLQARWFLRTAGYNNTNIHTAVELYFFALFLVMRFGVGSKLTFTIVTSNFIPLHVKACTVFLYVVSLAFIYYIYQYLNKKYFARFGNNSRSDTELKKEL